MTLCGAEHPEVEGVRCRVDGAPRHHYHQAPPDHFWPNTEVIEAEERGRRRPDADNRQRLLDMARAVDENVREMEADPPMPAFDAALGAQLRDQGIERSHLASPDDWKAEAREAIRLTALRLPHFTVDDIWAGASKPPEARALGALMLWAARQGWIEKTADFRPSAQPQAHRNPKQVWRSLIWAS